ncbi:hypothetical protein J5N97_006326 [Dioscorea zingiberensis]|uniref:Plastocyanin-like domain-containing protein n=1 Tax=Dioscorea zingiberensis TaxID=325984 RepID=A0A9D5DC02_9LILI|nr:hypothetical protein J5N97_006326 [Dioscorea zingiberensis]
MAGRCIWANCPIGPGKAWTLEFQVKDQIVNNRNVILVPFPKRQEEFDLLIGDWHALPYKDKRKLVGGSSIQSARPGYILINGKGSYNSSLGNGHQSIQVEQGKLYRLRFSNVGTELSFNFRIQSHEIILVETEGSHTNQIVLDSLDVHVGQSYSI